MTCSAGPSSTNDATIHEHDAIGDIARERHLMRHDNHGHVLSGELLDDLQHLGGKLRVERAGGLVEVKQYRGSGTMREQWKRVAAVRPKVRKEPCPRCLRGPFSR